MIASVPDLCILFTQYKLSVDQKQIPELRQVIDQTSC